MEPAENLISTLFDFLFIMFARFTLSLIVVKQLDTRMLGCLVRSI